MLGELIGEFKGKNTGWRVLSDGKIETTAQGTGKLLGMDVWIVNTTGGSMTNGLFMGEVSSFITTMTSDTAMAKGNAIAWSDGKGGGTTRAATIYTTNAPKLARLNKVIGIQEYDTDMENNFTGKIWEWK
jgi:hypothetical protein